MNDAVLNVVIILARCAKTKQLFGIRFEEISQDNWVYDWTFQITDEMAENEKYNRGRIEGTFTRSDKYRGCPYCTKMDFVQCGACKKITCHTHKSDTSICAWSSCKSYNIALKVGDGFITEFDNTTVF